MEKIATTPRVVVRTGAPLPVSLASKQGRAAVRRMIEGATKKDAVLYILAMATELAKVAHWHRLPVEALLLEMAQVQAGETAEALLTADATTRRLR